jgi:hypothetical protein
MRVGLGTKCARNQILNSNPAISLGAILHYEDAVDAEPTTTGVALLDHCDDETNLVPFVPNTVPSTIIPQDLLDLGTTREQPENFFRWTINNDYHRVNWSQPSLKTVLENGNDFGPHSNVLHIQTKDNVSNDDYDIWGTTN